jgi:hypothetical protein
MARGERIPMPRRSPLHRKRGPSASEPPKSWTISKAARAIKKSDADRADYLKRFYRVAEELHYDLVINIEAVSIEQAAALISHSAGLDTG